MRYAIAIVIGALTLLAAMAGNAAADQHVTELVSEGTTGTPNFSGASADGSDKLNGADGNDRVKGCEKVRRPRRR